MGEGALVYAYLELSHFWKNLHFGRKDEFDLKQAGYFYVELDACKDPAWQRV